MKFRSIADKLFNKEQPDKTGNGLFVTVEDLIAQRRYAYQWQLSRLNKMTGLQAGDVRSVFKGRGMEFEEIRAYAFGDDTRDIDWRVTARKQIPYTKLYTEEKDREVYVVLDFSSHMMFGTRKELKSVRAAKTASRIGWQCLKNKDRFGCVIFDGQEVSLLKAGNSQLNMMMILKKIADMSYMASQRRHSTEGEGALKKAVVLLQQMVKHRAIVFIISDFSDFSDDTRQALATFSKKANMTCVHVVDCLEKFPPVAGEYMVQQGEKRFVFSSAGASFQQEYIRYFSEKRSRIKDFCRRFSIHYVENFENIVCGEE